MQCLEQNRSQEVDKHFLFGFQFAGQVHKAKTFASKLT